MFPPRCAQPPWRNIEVKSVDQKGSGMYGARSRPAAYSRGTSSQFTRSRERRTGGPGIACMVVREVEILADANQVGVGELVVEERVRVGAVAVVGRPGGARRRECERAGDDEGKWLHGVADRPLV